MKIQFTVVGKILENLDIFSERVSHMVVHSIHPGSASNTEIILELHT